MCFVVRLINFLPPLDHQHIGNELLTTEYSNVESDASSLVVL